MAHNINTRNGKASAYYLKKPAWHGLGTVVDQPMSHPDMLHTAGLDFTVDKRGLYTVDMEAITTHKAIVRTDNMETLGIVGADYQPLQNSEVFKVMQESMHTRDLVVETAGVLGKGETVWMLARNPGQDFSIKGDPSRAYVLATSGHDGKTPFRFFGTDIRVQCENMLKMALSAGAGAGWKVKHTAGMPAALAGIAAGFRAMGEAREAHIARLQSLASARSTADSLQAITRAALDLEPSEAETARSRQIREAREKAVAVIRASETCNVAGTAGTLYADLQAVTEWIDHERGEDQAARFASAWFGGEGEDMKERAVYAALSLV
jgi:phage/plasmid-like protein (TIGR03299 family)